MDVTVELLLRSCSRTPRFHSSFKACRDEGVFIDLFSCDYSEFMCCFYLLTDRDVRVLQDDGVLSNVNEGFIIVEFQQGSTVKSQLGVPTRLDFALELRNRELIAFV